MISKEIENIIGAIPAFRRVALLFRVDPHEIDVSAERLEEILAKAIWFVIPFHVFLISRIYEGDIALMIFWSIVSILFVMVYGNLVALLDFTGESSYETKARQWSIVCVLLWAVSLMTIAASYLVGAILDAGGRDVITMLLNKVSPGVTFPDKRPSTFAIFLVYSLFAVAILQFLVGRARSRTPDGQDGHDAGRPVAGTSASHRRRRTARFFLGLAVLNSLVLFLSTVIFRTSVP